MTTIDSERVMYLQDDRFRMLEDETWAEMSQSVDDGSRTPEEMIDAFMEWRSRFKSVGSFLVEHSDDVSDGYLVYDEPETPPICFTCAEISCTCES